MIKNTNDIAKDKGGIYVKSSTSSIKDDDLFTSLCNWSIYPLYLITSISVKGSPNICSLENLWFFLPHLHSLQPALLSKYGKCLTTRGDIYCKPTLRKYSAYRDINKGMIYGRCENEKSASQELLLKIPHVHIYIYMTTVYKSMKQLLRVTQHTGYMNITNNKNDKWFVQRRDHPCTKLFFLFLLI